MTMSPLYSSGKPCLTGTHNETVKKLALFSAIIRGIMMESRLRVSVPWECFQFFNQIENSITFTNRKFYHIYTEAIVIHKSRNLVGTLRFVLKITVFLLCLWV